MKQSILDHLLDQFKDCADFNHSFYPDQDAHLLYFTHFLDYEKLQANVIKPFANVRASDMPQVLTQPAYHASADPKELVVGILSGKSVVVHADKAYLCDTSNSRSRSISQSETETVITGPHDAFNENAESTLSLIRGRVRSSHLKVVKLQVGELTKSDVYILYLADIANPAYIKELTRRIGLIEIDAVHDTNMLIQMIDDNPNSIFPQFITSERPDAIASKLVSGRIVGFMDGSPSVFSAPSSFFEFFSSSDDYYQRWLLGTATRLLRFLAFLITISFTGIYVAVTTYHYEMVPENLLLTLTESRSRVPFPPVIEALLMETTIELLREAGARLPTKIGQTIGIVGGIVIGQAAVQAGLTSNILIIAVASSAIASFVIPSYVMSASIRVIRFGLIALAGIWGNFGLTIGITAIVIHLCGLKSLGSSYLTPVAPSQFKDWKDVFIRGPFWMLRDRPTQSKPQNSVRSRIKR